MQRMEKTRSKRLITLPERRKFHVEREKRRGLRRIVGHLRLLINYKNSKRSKSSSLILPFPNISRERENAEIGEICIDTSPY